MEKKIIDLGYMNGWYDELPELFKKCPHRETSGLSQKKIYDCVTEYTCHKCGYKYTVDSSG